MATAAALKLEIEAKLAARIPGALSPLARQASRLQPTGVAAVDALLGGGLPLGSLCELTGPMSSGRTSLALALLAKASQVGACAYIDVGDSLHPHSAAAVGVQLRNLLWVRFAEKENPGSPAAKPGHLSQVQSEGTKADATNVQPQRGGLGVHPRTETRGLAPALEGMLAARIERRQRRMEGTPGYPNQPIGRVAGLGAASEEQLAWERFNTRKPDEADPLRQANQRAAVAARAGLLGDNPGDMRLRDVESGGKVTAWPTAGRAPESFRTEEAHDRRERRPWARLDAALRATDQVLQAGGFRVVVLDLASLRAEETLRVPSATWWRYRRAVGDSAALLVLLTPEPCARSSAACVLQCGGGQLVNIPRTQVNVLPGLIFQAEIARHRTGVMPGKKSPGRVTGWGAAPPWMRAAGR